jgi:hypothetical protein
MCLSVLLFIQIRRYDNAILLGFKGRRVRIFNLLVKVSTLVTYEATLIVYFSYWSSRTILPASGKFALNILSSVSTVRSPIKLDVTVTFRLSPGTAKI